MESSERTSTCFWEILPCGLPMGKIMDVSTGHITHDDAVLLYVESDADLPAVIVFRRNETGYFVHVPHDDIEESERAMRDVGYSRAFVNLVRIARAGGAFMLHLDANAASSEKLPVFDW